MDTIKKIWFKGTRIYMETNKGETYSRPLEAFPILKEATLQQRNDYTIGKDKTDIRWEALDEDIHINSFFDTTEPDHDNNIAITLRQFPQINISALANQIGINKSLLAKYIYGIKKPSAIRKKKLKMRFIRLVKSYWLWNCKEDTSKPSMGFPDRCQNSYNSSWLQFILQSLNFCVQQNFECILFSDDCPCRQN